MKPTDIFYPKETTEPDATSTTEEVITETEEVTPAEVKAEESTGEEATDNQGNDEQEESFYVEIDGEETSFEQIKEWKSGSMMQADYTRGKQEIAKQRKDLETSASELATQTESVASLTAELQALIGSEDEVNLDELRDVESDKYDPDEYIRLSEKKAKREKLLSKAKESLTATNPTSNADIAAEQQQLIENNPGWVDKDGKATKLYKSEMAALDIYLGNNGWTPEEFSTVYQSKHIEALLKAAKYDALQGKKAAITKKITKAPIIKKGKSAAKAPDNPNESIVDIFYPKK